MAHPEATATFQLGEYSMVRHKNKAFVARKRAFVGNR